MIDSRVRDVLASGVGGLLAELLTDKQLDEIAQLGDWTRPYALGEIMRIGIGSFERLYRIINSEMTGLTLGDACLAFGKLHREGGKIYNFRPKNGVQARMWEALMDMPNDDREAVLQAMAEMDEEQARRAIKEYTPPMDIKLITKAFLRGLVSREANRQSTAVSNKASQFISM